jgi:hypothetical protein
MSLAMRLLAPNLEEPTATDDGKVPALLAESSVPIKNMPVYFDHFTLCIVSSE